MPDEAPPTTRDVACAGCNHMLTISEPGPDSWDAMTEPDLNAAGRQLKIVGWRIVFKCTDAPGFTGCGTRTAIIREDDPQ